jgi:hypothetical protein
MFAQPSSIFPHSLQTGSGISLIVRWYFPAQAVEGHVTLLKPFLGRGYDGIVKQKSPGSEYPEGAKSGLYGGRRTRSHSQVCSRTVAVSTTCCIAQGGPDVPFLKEVSRFLTRINGTPNSPVFQQCFFITDTDFSLWHASSSCGLDA